MMRMRSAIVAGMIAVACLDSAASAQADREIKSLRAAVEDLAATHGAAYPRAADFLGRLREIEAMAGPERAGAFARLQREALLANPLLAGGEVLVVKRKAAGMKELGFPTNHECNSSLPRTGYNNPSMPGGRSSAEAPFSIPPRVPAAPRASAIRPGSAPSILASALP